MSTIPTSFSDLGVDSRIVEALSGAGITSPFPIQAMTLPVALEGHDIIGQAKTGTGKTLGFGIPVLQRVTPNAGSGPNPGDAGGPQHPQALIVVPTRELAVQVAQDLTVAATRLDVKVLTVYGGRAYEPQIEALRRGIEVVVGTPGRLIDLAQQGHLVLREVRCLVLDEADEMLDLGFLQDVEKLIGMTPDSRQTMLFSATMPGAVVSLARRYMTQPTHIRASDPTDTGATVQATAQFVYRAHSLDKIEMVARLLQANGRGLTIIFTRTKRAADRAAEDLAARGFAAAPIHGDLGQGAREQALRAFRNGKVDVLVATDVAARGIDVEDVTHVINYTCPEDEKTYLHRIGRTGRAGNTGIAVTFVDWDDLHRWALISKALDLGIPEPQETYSNSAHFFEDLHIPAGTGGTLPRISRTRAGLAAETVEDLGETGRQRRPAGRSGGPSGSDRGRSGGAGGAGRSGRSAHSGGSGRQDGGAARQDGGDPPSADDPRPPRQRRPRRRTRGGVPSDAVVGQAVGSASGSEAGTTTGAPSTESVSGPEGRTVSAPAEPGAGTRRRRRGRGGRGASAPQESTEFGQR